MLPFRRQNMIVDAEQLYNLDCHAVFFLKFANQRVAQGLAEIDLAAGEFPGSAFVGCRFAALGEEEFAGVIDYYRADSDADVICSRVPVSSSSPHFVRAILWF